MSNTPSVMTAQPSGASIPTFPQHLSDSPASSTASTPRTATLTPSAVEVDYFNVSTKTAPAPTDNWADKVVKPLYAFASEGTVQTVVVVTTAVLVSIVLIVSLYGTLLLMELYRAFVDVTNPSVSIRDANAKVKLTWEKTGQALATTQSDLRAIQDQIAQRTAQDEQERARMQDVTARAQGQIDDLTAKNALVTRLEQAIAHHETAAASKDAEIASKTKNLTAATEAAQTAQRRVDALSDQVAQLTAQCETLEQAKSGNDADLAAVRGQLQLAKREERATSADAAQKQQAAAALQTQVDRLTTENGTLLAKIGVLEQHHAHAQAAPASSTTRTEVFEEIKRELNIDIDQALQTRGRLFTAAEVNADITALNEATMAECQTLIAQAVNGANATMAALQIRIDELEGELATSRTQHEQDLVHVAGADQRVKELERDLADTQLNLKRILASFRQSVVVKVAKPPQNVSEHLTLKELADCIITQWENEADAQNKQISAHNAQITALEKNFQTTIDGHHATTANTEKRLRETIAPLQAEVERLTRLLSDAAAMQKVTSAASSAALNETRDRAATLDATVASLQKELTTTNEALAKAQTDAASAASAAAAQHTAELATLQTSLADAGKARSTALDEITALNERMTALQAHLDTANKAKDALGADTNAQKASVETSAKRIADLESQLAAAQAAHTEVIGQATAAKSSASDASAEQAARITALEQQLADLTKKHNEALVDFAAASHAQGTTAEEALASLQATHNEEQAKLQAQIDAAVKENEGAAAAIKTVHEEVDAVLAKAKQTAEEHASVVQKLKDQLAAEKAKLSDAQAAAKAATEAVNGQINDLSAQLTTLTAAKATAEHDAQEKTDALTALQANVAQLAADITSPDALAKTLSNIPAVQALRDKIAALNDRLTTVQTAQAEAAQKVDAEAAEAHAADVKKLQDALATAQASLQTAKDDAAGELAKLKADHETALKAAADALDQHKKDFPLKREEVERLVAKAKDLTAQIDQATAARTEAETLLSQHTEELATLKTAAADAKRLQDASEKAQANIKDLTEKLETAKAAQAEATAKVEETNKTTASDIAFVAETLSKAQAETVTAVKAKDALEQQIAALKAEHETALRAYQETHPLTAAEIKAGAQEYKAAIDKLTANKDAQITLLEKTLASAEEREKQAKQNFEATAARAMAALGGEATGTDAAPVAADSPLFRQLQEAVVAKAKETAALKQAATEATTQAKAAEQRLVDATHELTAKTAEVATLEQTAKAATEKAAHLEQEAAQKPDYDKKIAALTKEVESLNGIVANATAREVEAIQARSETTKELEAAKLQLVQAKEQATAAEKQVAVVQGAQATVAHVQTELTAAEQRVADVQLELAEANTKKAAAVKAAEESQAKAKATEDRFQSETQRAATLQTSLDEIVKGFNKLLPAGEAGAAAKPAAGGAVKGSDSTAAKESGSTIDVDDLLKVNGVNRFLQKFRELMQDFQATRAAEIKARAAASETTAAASRDLDTEKTKTRELTTQVETLTVTVSERDQQVHDLQERITALGKLMDEVKAQQQADITQTKATVAQGKVEETYKLRAALAEVNHTLQSGGVPKTPENRDSRFRRLSVMHEQAKAKISELEAQNAELKRNQDPKFLAGMEAAARMIAGSASTPVKATAVALATPSTPAAGAAAASGAATPVTEPKGVKSLKGLFESPAQPQPGQSVGTPAAGKATPASASGAGTPNANVPTLATGLQTPLPSGAARPLTPMPVIPLTPVNAGLGAPVFTPSKQPVLGGAARGAPIASSNVFGGAQRVRRGSGDSGQPTPSGIPLGAARRKNSVDSGTAAMAAAAAAQAAAAKAGMMPPPARPAPKAPASGAAASGKPPIPPFMRKNSGAAPTPPFKGNAGGNAGGGAAAQH